MQEEMPEELTKEQILSVRKMTKEFRRANTAALKMEFYWNDIPVGKENAVTYETLCARWGVDRRAVRKILHDLSLYENGDDYILIRSSKNGGGFYKTDDRDEMRAYRKECLNKGKSNFAPVKKINRILNSDADALQGSIFNNLKAVRLSQGLKQTDVVDKMRAVDPHFDVSMLSKFENGVCIPTPYQLARLAQIYGVQPRELIAIEDTLLTVYS